MSAAEIFDVAIIGAGVSGASTAWCLSKYHIRTVLLDKEVDVGFGVSKANSGIIHGGFHHAVTTLKARLEVRGNLLFERLQYELGFPFRRNGILVVAFSGEQLETVRRLYQQGIANGVRGLELCGRERLLELEPKLNPDTVGGMYAPNGGTIEPYRYVFSLVESAMGNGVELRTGFAVTGARRDGDCWVVSDSGGREVRARRVVNAAGLYADKVSRIFGAEEYTIQVRKGEEYLLDRNSAAYTRHVLFPVPDRHSKGVLVIPTVEGTTMVGPTAEMLEDKEDTGTTAANFRNIFFQVTQMVPGVSNRDIITAFAGMRPVLPGDDFYIDLSEKVSNFIQVAGIQSPGLTASPAIGEYVKDLLKKDGLSLTEKTEVRVGLPRIREIRHETPEEIDRLYQEDPAYANIICRCESISEAEIVNAIRRGHVTLDGIKFYTRAGMGRCQGGFCTYKILKIIARETGMPVEEISKRGGGSWLVSGSLAGIDPVRIPEQEG